jgi:hypothetical protein
MPRRSFGGRMGRCQPSKQPEHSEGYGVQPLRFDRVLRPERPLHALTNGCAQVLRHSFSKPVDTGFGVRLGRLGVDTCTNSDIAPSRVVG